MQNHPHCLLHSRTAICLTLFRKGLSHRSMWGRGDSLTLARCSGRTASQAELRLGLPAANKLTPSPPPCLLSRGELTRKADLKNTKQTHTHTLEKLMYNGKEDLPTDQAACTSLLVPRASLSPTKPKPALSSLPYANRWTLCPFKLQWEITCESCIFLNWTGAW